MSIKASRVAGPFDGSAECTLIEETTGFRTATGIISMHEVSRAEVAYWQQNARRGNLEALCIVDGRNGSGTAILSIILASDMNASQNVVETSGLIVPGNYTGTLGIPISLDQGDALLLSNRLFVGLKATVTDGAEVSIAHCWLHRITR